MSKTRDTNDEMIRILREKIPLESWSSFTETLNLPADIASAMVTGRPELLKLMQPRALSVEECTQLYQALGVLIETNMALQQHAQRLAQLVDHWTQGFDTLQSVGRQIQDFAHFRTSDEETDD